MNDIFERTINYYETDRMGVVHHSNYIRFLEEARCYFLENYDMPYAIFEEKGVIIPVVNVNISYKTHVTFSDTILIKVFIKEYTGVRFTLGYEATNKETGSIVVTAETKHCFTNSDIKPINLKKYLPEFSKTLEDLLENN